jgi:signal transduction histidine kinase
LQEPGLRRTVERMSKGSQRQVADIRGVLRFVQQVANAGTVELVYEAALNSISENFKPDRSFVALVDSENAPPIAHAPQPGWLSDVVLSIHAGEKIVGRFVLQYDAPHAFSEHDCALIEVTAALTGFAIDRVQALDAKKKKDELVAMATHELRSPITAIMGAAFLLRSGIDDDCIRAVDMIERNVRAEVTLIEELLQVCQLEARRVELHLKTVDLVSVLEKVVEEVQPIAASRNTLLHTRFQSPLTMNGDSQRLWQIFWNLLTNSVRFAPNGKVEITAASDSTVMTVCVRDNGIGISQDQLAHIFEPFHQAHSPAEINTYGGIGLGLTIVKDLVAMHGGTISAESDGLGKGACFRVSFPG